MDPKTNYYLMFTSGLLYIHQNYIPIYIPLFNFYIRFVVSYTLLKHQLEIFTYGTTKLCKAGGGGQAWAWPINLWKWAVYCMATSSIFAQTSPQMVSVVHSYFTWRIVVLLVTQLYSLFNQTIQKSALKYTLVICAEQHIALWSSSSVTTARVTNCGIMNHPVDYQLAKCYET